MWIKLCVSVLVGVLFGGVVLVAERVQQCERSRLSSNIVLTHDLNRVLLELYDRSPTFKAQCDRLAVAEGLHVVVRLDRSLPSHYRALTRICRRGGEIRADVHVPPGRALVELVAHEFEHVIEQLEGLDLRALARTRGSGVREIERELFESDRAERVGQVVADEAWRTKTPAAD
jgi:hypothetical protein